MHHEIKIEWNITKQNRVEQSRKVAAHHIR